MDQRDRQPQAASGERAAPQRAAATSPAQGAAHSREAAVRLLCSLGVLEPAATRIAIAGERLRRRMAQASPTTEFAAVFDVATGGRVGTIARGLGKQVDVSAHFQAMRPGHSYLALHTHPASTPFSLLDVKTFLAQPLVSVLAVVTLDGRWFVMSRKPGVEARADLASLILIAQAYSRLRPRYQAAAAVGAATEQQALAALLHHVWRAVANRLGVGYDWTP